MKKFKEFNKKNISNESWFSNKSKDEKLEEIQMKITKASFSLRTFGTMTKQGSFVNGANWAIFNLTDNEVNYIREHGDKGKFSFNGL